MLCFLHAHFIACFVAVAKRIRTIHCFQVRSSGICTCARDLHDNRSASRNDHLLSPPIRRSVFRIEGPVFGSPLLPSSWPLVRFLGHLRWPTMGQVCCFAPERAQTPIKIGSESKSVHMQTGRVFRERYDVEQLI